MKTGIIQQIIHNAFDNAVQNNTIAESEQKRNRKRSINWVESLADQFRIEFSENPEIRVFSKYYFGNKDFGMNELLYDISVCNVKTTKSLTGKNLTYIQRALWLVESEMARDTRQLVYDFNKLVIGDAENKLFVGPLTCHNDGILETLKKIAVNCKGNVWVAFVPHPGNWNNQKIEPMLWQFINKDFIYLEQIAL